MNLKLPWHVGEETWEGDGSAGVLIEDADNNIVAFVTSWPCDYPSNATPADWERAKVIVDAVNGTSLIPS